MTSPESKKPSLARRLDRIVRRERLRIGLRIAGFTLVVGGVLMAIYPFGPSVSNPVAIPKADPHAGLALAQSLPTGTALRLGLTLGLVGVALLLLLIPLGIGESRDDGNRKT
jgi:hypothetical protein